MGNNCSSKICKNPRKIVEFDFREVVGQKSGAVINMELFLSVFLKILQKFLELFKKVHTQQANSGVSRYLDQKYHFDCQNLTNRNWSQCHFHYQNQCITTPYVFLRQQHSVCHYQ